MEKTPPDFELAKIHGDAAKLRRVNNKVSDEIKGTNPDRF